MNRSVMATYRQLEHRLVEVEYFENEINVVKILSHSSMNDGGTLISFNGEDVRNLRDILNDILESVE